MTVEEACTWRARPVCDRCPWVGGWRTSTEGPMMAADRATADLAGHVAFWHADRAGA